PAPVGRPPVDCITIGTRRDEYQPPAVDAPERGEIDRANYRRQGAPSIEIRELGNPKSSTGRVADLEQLEDDLAAIRRDARRKDASRQDPGHLLVAIETDQRELVAQRALGPRILERESTDGAKADRDTPDQSRLLHPASRHARATPP